jgi:hypothetical protein
MTKLKLDLDTLDVQSFPTSSAEGERGTVHGAIYPTDLCSIGCDTHNCPSLNCTNPTQTQ